MKGLTRLFLAAACVAAASSFLSCGGKGPAEPTKSSATSTATAAADDDEASVLANSTMRWSLADRCADGRGLQWRLFDIVSNKRYPTSGVFRTPVGGTATKSISCVTGHKICIGGTTQPASSLSFGVGINGTRRSGGILRSVACRACGNVAQRLALFCSRVNGLSEGESELEEDSGFSELGAEESAAYEDPASE